jgi:divalent metal cation (Fe/Co/Zn/Cd) transporter
MDALRKKALYLEYLTVGYNIAEGAASIIAGYMAGSVALAGFGFDSAIESASGAILVWRLRKDASGQEERAEKKAVRLVAVSFFVLAVYIFWESVEKLYFGNRPQPTLPGLIIAALSLAIMPLLARAKYRVALRMKSVSLAADSMQTLVCSLLSATLLLGLGLNYLFGVWWADPVSALLIVVFIIWEGIETLREGLGAD